MEIRFEFSFIDGDGNSRTLMLSQSDVIDAREDKDGVWIKILGFPREYLIDDPQRIKEFWSWFRWSCC